MIFRLWRRMWDGTVKIHHVKGNKKELFAVIGFFYSTSIEKIDRISYTEIKRPLLEDETYFEVTDNGYLREYDYKGELKHTFR